MAGIRRDPVPSYRATSGSLPAIRDATHGLHEVVADRGLRPIVGLLSLSFLVEGLVDVLVVLVAIDVLGLGGSGVGWLNACWGLGGLVGGGMALGLLGRGRLAGGLALGSVLVGVSLMLAGALAAAAVAAAMLVLLGVGYALIEIAGLSLLQRLTSNDVLARAFAVVETSYWITHGIGAILAPAIIHLLGVGGALIFAGACLPALVVLRWAPLTRLEAGAAVPERPFKALRGVSLFEPLPLATIEAVSRKVDELRVRTGEIVIREGEHGDRFYVVGEGLLDISSAGNRFPSVTAGDFFGEIALLQDIPRTATVTARQDCLLYALDRESFLCAVSSHAFSTRMARRVASERLHTFPVA